MAESLGLTQERLFARNQNFQNSSTTPTSGSFAVSLRKKKRTDYVCEKRKREIESSSPYCPISLPPNRATLSQIKEYLIQGADSPYFTTSLNYLSKALKQEDRALMLKISKDLDLVSIFNPVVWRVPTGPELRLPADLMSKLHHFRPFSEQDWWSVR